MKKNREILGAIIVIIFVLAIGFIAYSAGKQKPEAKQPATASVTKPDQSSNSQPQGWKNSNQNIQSSQNKTFQSGYGYDISYAGNYFYKDITGDIKNDQSIVGHGGGPTPKNEVIFSTDQNSLNLEALNKQNYDYTIAVYDNTDVQTLLGAPIDSQFAHFSKMNIGGVDWTKEETLSDPDKGAVSLAVTKNGLTYNIHITGKAEQSSRVIDAMLSSFRFTR